jgi:hypothetical protein
MPLRIHPLQSRQPVTTRRAFAALLFQPALTSGQLP